MQAGTTKDFVAQAKTRPYSLEQQKRFAIDRTQAQLKIPREDAAKLVEEVWDLPLDELRVRKEQHGVDQPPRLEDHQQQ
jgi:hypothetical protein